MREKRTYGKFLDNALKPLPEFLYYKLINVTNTRGGLSLNKNYILLSWNVNIVQHPFMCVNNTPISIIVTSDRNNSIMKRGIQTKKD